MAKSSVPARQDWSYRLTAATSLTRSAAAWSFRGFAQQLGCLGYASAEEGKSTALRIGGGFGSAWITRRRDAGRRSRLGLSPPETLEAQDGGAVRRALASVIPERARHEPVPMPRWAAHPLGHTKGHHTKYEHHNGCRGKRKTDDQVHPSVSSLTRPPLIAVQVFESAQTHIGTPLKGNLALAIRSPIMAAS
jgi:hypothetical protein